MASNTFRYWKSLAQIAGEHHNNLWGDPTWFWGLKPTWGKFDFFFNAQRCKREILPPQRAIFTADIQKVTPGVISKKVAQSTGMCILKNMRKTFFIKSIIISVIQDRKASYQTLQKSKLLWIHLHSGNSPVKNSIFPPLCRIFSQHLRPRPWIFAMYVFFTKQIRAMFFYVYHGNTCRCATFG